MRPFGECSVYGEMLRQCIHPSPQEGFVVNQCPNERSQGEQKRVWSRIIHILKDRNCLLFAEKDLCDGQFSGLYEYVDFVAFEEELLRREKLAQ